jgi:hypothetical protein
MSDLSRLIDDLYATSTPTTDTDESLTAPEWPSDEALDDLYATATPTTDEGLRAPEWSSAEALDEVFASWVPGPSDDAPAAQRSVVAEATTETMIEMPADDGWLVETEPVAAPEPAMAMARWSPSDDDILPTRRARRRR